MRVGSVGCRSVNNVGCRVRGHGTTSCRAGAPKCNIASVLEAHLHIKETPVHSQVSLTARFSCRARFTTILVNLNALIHIEDTIPSILLSGHSVPP